ncbi:unnamed protein product [Parnassius mnemosyne]|uniref:Reverse transcriptase domain-containing protein n=1 Tax=Parnassius mnemosyne TaxID=213953 RepID=A0AAV1LU89_9NEOP
MGWLHVEKPAALLAEEFSGVVTRCAEEGLGERRPRGSGGYEWWTPELEKTRKLQCKLRRAWQSKRRLGGRSEEIARMAFHDIRARYRKMMVEAQQSQHIRVANTGNEDPWGLSYRLASGRVRPPANVINGIAFAGGHPDRLEAAMQNLMSTLCPDDSPDCDTAYHRQVRLLAAFVPSGGAAPPLTVGDLGGIVKALPNTAPGLDGVSARIVRNIWMAAPRELHLVYAKCVVEGVFPKVWKDGRLIVIPKGNDKPLTDAKAYRPITLLPVLGKLLERVMLRCAPAISRGISEYQHGFSPGRSTVTALRVLLSTAKYSRACYVQAIFLDISGAFDNAWWPMMMVKAKRGGCPPNIYKMLVDYFTSRRVGLFIGDRVEWKTSTMGCPQGSVLGPTLWNVLMDDLLRLPLPEGVAMTAYADDVTILIESQTRAGIESRARVTLDLVREWGLRNRLEFSSSKSTTMTVRGKLQRPPVIKLGGESIKNVTNTKVVVEVMVALTLALLQFAHKSPALKMDQVWAPGLQVGARVA